MIGEALRQRPHLRDDVIVTTKAGRTYEGFDFSYDGILSSVYASLERMGLDRLELVYIHDPMGYPMEDVLSDRGAFGRIASLAGPRRDQVYRGRQPMIRRPIFLISAPANSTPQSSLIPGA